MVYTHRAHSEAFPDVTEPDATEMAFAWSIFASRWVATDDPRLKEK